MTDCPPPPEAVALVEGLVADHAAQDPTTAWLWGRMKDLEEQRQTLHEERDTARAEVEDWRDAFANAMRNLEERESRIGDLEATVQTLRTMVQNLSKSSR